MDRLGLVSCWYFTGITYVTFNKTSEAVLAQEEMNGRVMPGHPKPLKVVLAAEKEQGNMREDNEQEKLLRIFIKVPRTHTEGVIQDYFKVRSSVAVCACVCVRTCVIACVIVCVHVCVCVHERERERERKKRGGVNGFQGLRRACAAYVCVDWKSWLVRQIPEVY